MADLFPDLASHAIGQGQYREFEMLRLLAAELPASCRIYHGVQISNIHEGIQRYGELDAVVVFPSGHLAVLEIKAGDVDLSDGAYKQYGQVRKNLAHQAHAQLQGLIARLRAEHLGEVRIAHFLLLPDFRISSTSISYPRERIIDAGQLDAIPQILADATRFPPLPEQQVQRLYAFLANRFEVVPDAACRKDQVQAATRRLSEGLATWVPRIQSPSGLYVVEATAGSGKTQLALTLLQDAAAKGRRARYVCFNRPLADHIARIAPARCEASTVHELAIAALRGTGIKPDFHAAGTFDKGMQALAAANANAEPILDTLVIDEMQDFDGTWVEALLPRLKPSGSLYLLGDAEQAIYGKEAFELAEATRITCRDNFRTPRRIVEVINLLGLTETPIVPKAPVLGEMPTLHTHGADDADGLKRVARVVDDLLKDGHSTADIAILSFRGREHSRLLASEKIGDRALRRFTGKFDDAGNALWTPGELLAETVYRFKGQSAPIVVVCEIDFESLDERSVRKLFVAMTRAQEELHLVMSTRAEAVLVDRLSR